MHKYVATRGDWRAVDRWKEDLAAMPLPFESKDKKGKIHKWITNLQLRPVLLWELVYPKDCDETVMGALKPTDLAGFAGKYAGKIKWLLNKLKLDTPITKYKKLAWPMGEGVSVFVLGDKQDEIRWTRTLGANSLSEHFKHTPQEQL